MGADYLSERKAWGVKYDAEIFSEASVRKINTAIEIAAPVEAVWAALTDFERYPVWNPFIRSAHGVLGKGEVLKISMDLGEKGRQDYKVAVTGLVPSLEFRWQGFFKVRGLIDGDHAFRLQDSPIGTLLTHDERFTGILVPFVWQSFIVRHLEPSFVNLNENLKAYCEGRSLPVAIPSVD